MKKPVTLTLVVTAILAITALAGLALQANFEDTEASVIHEHATQEEAMATVPEYRPPAATSSKHQHAGANQADLDGSTAGDAPDDQLGMERPRFPPAEGKVPSASDARSLEQVGRIMIRSDDDATPAAGIRVGSGTLEDPFVISGYYVTGDLFLADTDSCFVIKENYIGGQLTLNWNAQCVHAHHNFVRDLRVNENVDRTGYATGGLIEYNKIEYIGQLRHYDGEFRHNVVGPRTANSMWDTVLETVPWMFAEDPRVANVDGFNQGLIHHNTFFGSVDLDLHGHHHGTGFYAPHSHYHGEEMNRSMAHDHTLRWTSVFFTDNEVIDPEGYGLRYEDRNHAGDDRTARSEDEDDLDLDHQHFTRVVLARNSIKDAGLIVDVFNADDENHYTRNPGWLEIRDNTIDFAAPAADDTLGLQFPWWNDPFERLGALRVFAAKEAEVTIEGNTITNQPVKRDSGPLSAVNNLWGYNDVEPAAIDLRQIRDSDITLRDNTADGFTFGVRAHEFDALAVWRLAGNDFGSAKHPVFYDDSVENRPDGE